MSTYLIPVLMGMILCAALWRRVPVYTEFLAGAEQGMRTVIGIFPCLVAVLAAVEMLKASGVLGWFLNLISPLTAVVGVPEDVLQLALIRPISGSGALGVLADLFRTHSPDSEAGRIASVLMGSTETTFYTLMVYFSGTRVQYTKRVIPAAVFGDIVGLLASIFICKIIF